MQTGFYPGSFDPITLGHIDIINRSLALFDKLVIGIGVHATKQSLFSMEERIEMITQEITPLAKKQNAELEVVTFDGLLVDAARKHKSSAIVRGLRTAQDFEYEAQMTAMNRIMAKDIETIFLSATPEVGFISSTLVRQISAMGGDVAPFVPKSVLQKIKAK